MASKSTRGPTLAVDNLSRQLPSWIGSWCDATIGTGSPELLRRWCGIATISIALERRCWLHTSKGQLFPNLYMFLVAPPGVGKTLMLNLARQLLEGLSSDDNKLHTAPSNISSAALADALAAANRKVVPPGADAFTPAVTFNSLALLVAELGVFLPEYDPRMMNTLTDLYDCGGYREMKRGGDLKIDLPAAQLNLLGACTPSYLNAFVPPAAWDQGFMSRVIMAYSGETTERPIFGDDSVDLPQALAHDLGRVFSLYGEFIITDGYKHAINQWQMAGREPLPTHPRLQHYNTRRLAHILKLSMVASANRRNNLVLDEEDFFEARDWLVEAEGVMPEIFKASGMSGDSAIMEDCFHFMFRAWQKEKAPMPEHRVLDFLRQRVAGAHVFQILSVMERSRMIERITQSGEGARPFYRPVPVVHHQ